MQGTTHLVLGRPGLARSWSRPWEHTWPWGFRPMKDLTSGLQGFLEIQQKPCLPWETTWNQYDWQRNAFWQGGLHHPSYQAAPLLWPESTPKTQLSCFYQAVVSEKTCISAEIGHQQKLPQNPPIGSNDTNITSNKLFIFPNIVSIWAHRVTTQRSQPELFVWADNLRNLSGIWNVVKQIELKVGQMY